MSELKATSQKALLFPFLLCCFLTDAIALDIQYSKRTAKGCQLPENAIVLSGRIHQGDNEKYRDGSDKILGILLRATRLLLLICRGECNGSDENCRYVQANIGVSMASR